MPHARRPRPSTLCAAALALWAAGQAPQAEAAGGHHAVSPASTLEPGRCRVDAWATRAQDGGRALHASTECGWRGWDLGVGADREHEDGGHRTTGQLRAKWAQPLSDRWAVGLALRPGWRAGEHAGTSAALLASWTPTDSFGVHANLGWRFVPGSGDGPRHGVSLDWRLRPAWTATVERFREDDGQFTRAGLRWHLSKDWRVDASHARSHGPAPSRWTIGLRHEWGGSR